MTILSQRTFSSGEISPSLYARVDLTKYATGLRVCKNNIVLRYGGVSNRPGTTFVSEVSDSSKAVRLIPFIFNDDQTYVLEFGDQYMRVIQNGVLLTSATYNITNITQANPGVVTTSASHGLSNGDEVYVNGVLGMTQINNRNFKVNNVTATTYELQDMDGVNLDTSGYTAYSSAGTSANVYEISTPYLEADLATLNYVQSADVITIAHPNYRPRELVRTGDTNWTLSEIELTPTTTQPTNVAASAGAAGSLNFSYKVTAIDEETGEESLAGTISAAGNITAITNANPGVVTTSAAHGFVDGDEVYIAGVGNMTEVNNKVFIVTNLSATTFELNDTDTTNYATYTTGGTARGTAAKIVTAATPSTSAPHTITWDRVANAIEYNVYKESNGVYGQIGVASSTSFDDININPNTSLTPPTSRDPFIGADNYPSVVTYIQQRLAFANTNNDTEKIYLSRTSNFKNFTKSTPTQADDAITFNIAGREVNAVKALLDLGRLVIMSSGGEWAAEGENGTITPTAINTKQYSYNGSGNLQPILIDGAAIYQQSRGSIIRDLEYRFEVDGYQGNDLTIFSAHLFDKYTLVDWAYQQIPHSIVWAVRSDGVLLGMTYVKSQEVIAWHRHDLGGTVEKVAVVPESNEDVLYVVVKRTINGSTRRYIERLSSRQINNIVDNKFMDSNLSYDGRNTGSTTMTLSGGTTWASTETLTLTSSTSYFVSGDVGNAIHFTDSTGSPLRFTIEGYTSATVVTGKAHKTVPTDLRSTATTIWTKAVDTLAGLWHLEGKQVSVFADGFVVASPNNASYDTITVTDGSITLDKPHGVIHVGLPYLSDIETLDVDTPNGQSLADKRMIVNEVTLYAEETRGIWAGATPPSDDTVDPLEGLSEAKLRDDEGYELPPNLTTDKLDITIRAEWNSNGRVFIRQVDPIPMTILSINPSGTFPFSN